jgi:hypothetical protein
MYSKILKHLTLEQGFDDVKLKVLEILQMQLNHKALQLMHVRKAWTVNQPLGVHLNIIAV